jgi:hypothetical protein
MVSSTSRPDPSGTEGPPATIMSKDVRVRRPFGLDDSLQRLLVGDLDKEARHWIPRERAAGAERPEGG